ncbi:MAG: ATPase, T2SS/T4P/T4SS family [Actinomycetota bacterium]
MSDDLVARLHRRMLDRASSPGDAAALVRDAAPLLGDDDRAAVTRELLARLTGLGPLDPFMIEPGITEIMVNGPGPVWVERAGRIEETEVALSAAELDVLIERILAPVGRRIDPLQPWVDARLADGSRVNIVAAPIAIDGPVLTIRRFAPRRLALADFASAPVASELRRAVDDGHTVLVSGGTGAGKTSLLNAMASHLSRSTRVVTVEDAAELDLGLPHVVRLECRRRSVEGDGEVAVRDLVRTALRMRPDRLVIGEIRGPEAFDLMQAFNTGHRGGLSTIHANSPADAIRRLLTLVLSSGAAVPAEVIEDQLASAIDLVVQVARGADGARRVTGISALVGPGELRSVMP